MPVHYISYTLPDDERPDIERLHGIIADTKEEAVARFAVEFSSKEKPWNRPQVVEVRSYQKPLNNWWTVEFCHNGVRHTQKVKAASTETAVAAVFAEYQVEGFQLLSIVRHD